MFQETLLESSPTAPRRRRWPMATAFTVQMLVVSALVAVPLLSATILPIMRPSMPVPLSYEKPAPIPQQAQPAGRSHGTSAPTHDIVIMSVGHPQITWGNASRNKESQGSDPTPCFDAHCVAVSSGPPNLLPIGTTIKPPRPSGPVRMSHMDEGQLINRVIPVYPPMAGRTGVQGEVKLHAIIARDGTIQSLSVISGHPMLTMAAMEAVQQWRYRPYVLNGEAVEVDTYITVNFKRSISN